MNADSAFRGGSERSTAGPGGGGSERSTAGPGGESADGWGRCGAYDAYADGLHTYALWSLRDHDAAVDALYCAFVIADRNVTQLRQPDLIQPWLYAILRSECAARATAGHLAPAPVSGRRHPPQAAAGHDAAELGGSLANLERSLRRAEFHSLEWSESEGLSPAHREILELTIRHGLDSRGLGLVLGLNQPGVRIQPAGAEGAKYGAASGSPVGAQGFGVLADAWRELERSLAAVAVARGLRESPAGSGHCAQLAELLFGWNGKLNATLRGPLTEHVDRCPRCQNYLHTVVGTPAAPTILPFVAAPRTLRELILVELNDPAQAARFGIDHHAIATRAARFTPEGFPALGVVHQPRRTAHRRAPKRGAARAEGRAADARTSAAATGAVGAAAAMAEGPQSSAQPPSLPGALQSYATPSAMGSSFGPQPGTPVAASPASGPKSLWTPAPAPSSTPEPGSAPGSAAGPLSRPLSGPVPDPLPGRPPRPPARPLFLQKPVPPGPPMHVVNPPLKPELSAVYRAPGSWADRVLPALADEAAAAAPTPSANGLPHRVRSNGPSRPQFVDTASGRFAASSPAPRFARPASGAVAGIAPGLAPAHGPGFAGGAPGGPAGNPTVGPTAGPAAGPPPRRTPADRSRARHKSKPVRQAVLSAMALGAVGAMAAASAAVLGLTSADHPTQVAGGAPPDPLVGAGSGPGGLSLPVTSGPTGQATAPATAPALAAPGITASVIVTSPPAPAPGQSTAPAADFFISVNQRSADPDSVSILLRNTGTAAVSWSASPQNRWITLSQSSGTLAAGASLTITANATAAAPDGQWTSQVSFAPGNQVVVLHGGIPTPPPTTTPPTTTPPTTTPPTTTPPTTTPPTTTPPTTTPPTTTPPTTTPPTTTPPTTTPPTTTPPTTAPPTAKPTTDAPTSAPTTKAPTPTPTSTGRHHK